MLRKIFLTALLLPVMALTMLGHASATTDGPYTQASLSSLLLTGDELSAALSFTDNKTSFSNVADVPPATTPDPIGVGRVYVADDGSFIIASLFSYANGAPPSGTVLDGIFNGDLMKAMISGFKNVDGFTLGPSILGDDIDRSAAFAGSLDGSDYHVYANSYVKNNVFGAIVYAVPTSLPDPDYLVLAAMLGGQGAKLP